MVLLAPRETQASQVCLARREMLEDLASLERRARRDSLDLAADQGNQDWMACPA